MTNYYVETKVGNRWTLLYSSTRHKEALHYVKEHPSVKYPLRIMKVTRTVVFEDKNK